VYISYNRYDVGTSCAMSLKHKVRRAAMSKIFYNQNIPVFCFDINLTDRN